MTLVWLMYNEVVVLFVLVVVGFFLFFLKLNHEIQFHQYDFAKQINTRFLAGREEQALHPEPTAQLPSPQNLSHQSSEKCFGRLQIELGLIFPNQPYQMARVLLFFNIKERFHVMKQVAVVICCCCWGFFIHLLRQTHVEEKII